MIVTCVQFANVFAFNDRMGVTNQVLEYRSPRSLDPSPDGTPAHA